MILYIYIYPHRANNIYIIIILLIIIVTTILGIRINNYN